jgi:hypothetical protein
MEQREHVVVTVEALRCHRCRAVMDPRGPVFRQQMMTSVSVGSHDTTHTYALVDVCQRCHDAMTKADVEERRRTWWLYFWCWAFMLNAFCAIIWPINTYPFWAALGLRVCWKWWAKRRQRLTPGQTAQQVPQTMAPSAAEERTKSNPSS